MSGYDVSGELGCPARYDVRLHWRGGASLYYAPVDLLRSVTWSRRLDEISEATVVLAKAGDEPDCCGPVGRLEPWAHELSVYRDAELVWQGPIRRVIERRAEWEIQAADVLAWMDKRIQRVDYTPVDNELSDMARSLISTAIGQPDDLGIRDYMQVRNSGIRGDLDVKAGTKTTWEILQQDLLPQGLDMTTVGRAVLIGPEADAAAPAQARLSDEDIGGDLEVEVNGSAAVTRQWVHGGPRRNPDDPDDQSLPDVIEYVGGRTDTWSLLEDLVTNTSVRTVRQARAMASTLQRQLRPPLIVVRVPDNAHLSQLAPVTMRQLVPGQRLDVITHRMCRRVRAGLRLAQLQVTWTDSAPGETVQVSFVPLRGEEIDSGG